MSSSEFLIYTIRPDGTSLWVPWWRANRLGIKSGARLTADQYNGSEIQELLAERRLIELGPKEGSTIL